MCTSVYVSIAPETLGFSGCATRKNTDALKLFVALAKRGIKPQGFTPRASPGFAASRQHHHRGTGKAVRPLRLCLGAARNSVVVASSFFDELSLLTPPVSPASRTPLTSAAVALGMIAAQPPPQQHHHHHHHGHGAFAHAFPATPLTPTPTAPLTLTPTNLATKSACRKERKHQCPSCPKKFESTSKLSRHSRVHTGAKPFVCTLCDGCFPQKGGLKIHSVRHAREHMASKPLGEWSFGDKINGFTVQSLIEYRKVPAKLSTPLY